LFLLSVEDVRLFSRNTYVVSLLVLPVEGLI
jgi:hypothetical protein